MSARREVYANPRLTAASLAKKLAKRCLRELENSISGAGAAKQSLQLARRQIDSSKRPSHRYIVSDLFKVLQIEGMGFTISHQNLEPSPYGKHMTYSNDWSADIVVTPELEVYVDVVRGIAARDIEDLLDCALRGP